MSNHTEDHEHKLDIVCLQCVINKYKQYDKLLAFLKELAKDFPDRDDYRDCLKDESRELLMEIGELDESIKTD